MKGVSTVAMPISDLKGSFPAVYQLDLIMVRKCITFELDVRLENFRK